MIAGAKLSRFRGKGEYHRLETREQLLHIQHPLRGFHGERECPAFSWDDGILGSLRFLMAWTALSAYFVSVLAHCTVLVFAIWDTHEYVIASLPQIGWTAREYTDVETSLTVALSLAIAFCVLEILILCCYLLSPVRAIFAMILHVLASIFLLKFILDAHPLYHFWIAFGVFSVPALFISCVNLCISLKIKEHC